jgi:hypothetical protein
MYLRSVGQGLCLQSAVCLQSPPSARKVEPTRNEKPRRKAGFSCRTERAKRHALSYLPCSASRPNTTPPINSSIVQRSQKCCVVRCHFRTDQMSHHDECDCPQCRTELLSCKCGRNKMCPRCTFRIMSLPCACHGGLAEWRFKRADTLSDFVDHLAPPTGMG